MRVTIETFTAPRGAHTWLIDAQERDVRSIAAAPDELVTVLRHVTPQMMGAIESECLAHETPYILAAACVRAFAQGRTIGADDAPKLSAMAAHVFGAPVECEITDNVVQFIIEKRFVSVRCTPENMTGPIRW